MEVFVAIAIWAGGGGARTPSLLTRQLLNGGIANRSTSKRRCWHD